MAAIQVQIRRLLLLAVLTASGSVARADVAEELARMLAKYPAADADGDGTLSKQEAGRYLMRTVQRKRPNRGPGIRDRALIDAYEAHTFESLPYRLLKPLSVEDGRRYPLILSLHGSGGVGGDNLSNLRQWNGVMARQEWREKYPAFVVAPQRRPGGIWGPKPRDERFADYYVRNDLTLAFQLITKLQRELPIDDKRIYVLGSSGGGVGTWNALLAHPEMFAAAIPVCGRFPVADDEQERVAKLTGMPIWCFHGDADPLVEVENSRRAFARLKDAGGVIKYTELRGVEHNSWIQAFSYTGDDDARGYATRHSSDRCDATADVWAWLFRQRKP